MFENLAKVLKGVAALVAAAPGVAMLAKVVPVPPPEDSVIAAITLAFGAGVVLAVMLLQDWLRKFSAMVVSVVVVFFMLAGAFMAMQYASFTNAQIVHYENVHKVEVRVIKPVTPSTELRQIMANFDDDYPEALNNPIVGPKVGRLLETESRSTQFWLVVYLLAAQTLLLIGFVAGAWKLAQVMAATGKLGL